MSAMTGIPSPLWTENERQRTVIAALQQKVAELEARVIAASDTVYDLISELADATGRQRSEIEAAFLGEVQA